MRQSWYEHQERMATDPVYAEQHNAEVARRRAALAEITRLEEELGLDN